MRTQKQLKGIAKEVADDVHKHYGCRAHNERRIFEALLLVQRETKQQPAEMIHAAPKKFYTHS